LIPGSPAVDEVMAAAENFQPGANRFSKPQGKSRHLLPHCFSLIGGATQYASG
jgi:hypothetical protein